MKTWLLASVATLALGLASAATAQQQQLGDNMEKLQAFQATGTSMDFRTIEQTGDYADQLRKNLEGIELPDGFKIDLYDVDYQYGSSEPSDPEQTRRVLTLLLLSEY